MSFFIIAAVIVVVVAVLVFLGRRRTRTRRRRERETPHQMGLDALIAGDRDVAMKHLTRAVREDPSNVDAFVKLGNLLRERGQVKQAIQIHRELLVKRKLPAAKRTETVKSLARDLAIADRWPEVLDNLASLPRSERNAPGVLAMTRDAYEALGDLDKAAQAHKDVLKADQSGMQPSPGVYRAHLGLLALGQGDKKRARAEFQTAVKEDPEAFLAYVHLGDIAAEEGDHERAIAYWMKLVGDRPDCASMLFERLEKAYFELGDFGRMMSVYEGIVANSPLNVKALTGLSKMLERKGDIDEALRFASEAAKHEGDGHEGTKQHIEILMRNGRFEEAARVAEELLANLKDHSVSRSCPSCGASVEEHGWRCGACRAWIHGC